MKAVIDSSSLIFLFKVPAVLEIVKRRYSSIIVPAAVYEEVVENGKDSGKSDAFEIERHMNHALFKISEEKEAVAREQIGKGEAQALAIARKHKMPLMSDDRLAHRIGAALGVNVIPISSFIVWAVKSKLIDKQKGMETLDQLVNSGYYLKTQTYTKIKEAIQSPS